MIEEVGPYSQETAASIIIYSLHDGFKQFRLDYYNREEKKFAELHDMLITVEHNFQNEPKWGFKVEWSLRRMGPTSRSK